MKTINFTLGALLCSFLQVLHVCGNSSSIDVQEHIDNKKVVSGNLFGIRHEGTVAAELNTANEPQIVQKYAKLLSDSINTYYIGSKPTHDIKQIYNDIHVSNNYGDDIIHKIYRSAFNMLHIRVRQLPPTIWRIYEEEDQQLFEIMLNLQLSYFDIARFGLDTKRDKISLNFAYIMQKITNNDHYRMTDNSTQSRVDNAIRSLKSSIRYTFLKEYFCLFNKQYSNYIFTSRNNIWLWKDNVTAGRKSYIKAEIPGHSTDGVTIKALLRSTHYDKYYAIGAIKLWTIYFHSDDYVTIFNNETLMCATEKADDLYREVKLISYPANLSACEWRLGKCDFSG